MRHTGNPQDFGRVALVMGGVSAERNVSLNGGANVLQALRRRQINVAPVDGIPALLQIIAEQRVDRVFNLLHGRGGEDGTLQGALCCLGVPVTGSDVLGSSLSMNKSLSKRIWQQDGLATASHIILGVDGDAVAAAAEIGPPLVVKPVSEGSSFGIHIVHDIAALQAAVEELLELVALEDPAATIQATELPLEDFLETIEGPDFSEAQNTEQTADETDMSPTSQ